MTKSILAKTPSGEIQLTITIPQETVKKTYEEVINEVIKETEIPGFRKGKAPRKLVEEKIDKSKVYEEVLQKIVPQAYLEAAQEHKIKPIVQPKIELLKAKEGEDWEIRATTCEKPEVDLGDYKEEIRKALASEKLWTPDKKEPSEKDQDPESKREERTQKAINLLLGIVKVNLSSMLIEDEVNRALSNLINQTNSLGLTVDQYLASINKTGETIREEYRQKVASDLKLQFALDAIAEKEKIEIPEKEIDDLIAASGDAKLKESLNSPLERAYLKGLLSRRKALDFLGRL